MENSNGTVDVDHDYVKDSLQRRLSALHTLWDQALGSMEAEHVNHFERPGVLPIAFSVVHLVCMEDESLARLRGGDTLWKREGWAQATGVVIDDPGRERSVSEMQEQRIEDYAAFCAYSRLVFEQTDAWLDQLPPEELTHVHFDRLPDNLSQTYSALVVGSQPLLVHDAIECWIYQHGVRHLGELEHARALVGLGGLTS